MKIYYYGDISTIKHINVFFHQKLESIQYKAALPIIEDSIVNFVAFAKFSRFTHLGIYLTLFLQPKDPALQEMIANYAI